jgi:parvulin-like peptidyl-prolyl isomerase
MHGQGLTDRSLFETVRGDLLTDRVWASLVAGVRTSDEEAQRYYEAKAEELVIGEEVRLRIIAVKDEAAAEEILAALRKGASFQRLARQRSLGIRAAQGGDTGWVDSRRLPEPLQKPLQRLKPGDVAGPLEKGPGEFLVVGLEGRRPIRPRSLAEARPEIERRLLPSAQQEAVRAWLTEQEAKSKIEVFTEAELSHAGRRR